MREVGRNVGKPALVLVYFHLVVHNKLRELQHIASTLLYAERSEVFE